MASYKKRSGKWSVQIRKNKSHTICKTFIEKLCNAARDEEVRKRLEKVDRFSCAFRCFKNGSPFICVYLKAF